MEAGETMDRRHAGSRTSASPIPVVLIPITLLLTLAMNSLAQQEPGTIQIKAAPGIQVLLDGDLIGLTDAAVGGIILQDVPPGRHALLFAREGFQSRTVQLMLAPGEILRYTLEPLVPSVTITEEGNEGQSGPEVQLGTLTIQCLPIECTVSIPELGISDRRKTRDILRIAGVSAGEYTLITSALGKTQRSAVGICGASEVNVLTDFIAEPVETTVRIDSGGAWPDCPPPVTPIRVILFRALRDHAAAVLSVAFSPDGNLLASGSRDGAVRLWEVAGGREASTLRGHTEAVSSVAFSPDGNLLASGSRDGTVRLWEVAGGREVNTLRGYAGMVSSVVFSPDGSLLASAASDQTIKLWEVADGREVNTLRGHTNAVLSVAFSPDGSLLASASRDGTVKLWDVADGREVNTLREHIGTVFAVAFSPDGRMLASAASDRTIKLWDVRTGQEMRTLSGHDDAVLSVAFSPDGSLLASGSRDGTVRLWDAVMGRELRALPGHEGGVESVAFAPGGTLLAGGTIGDGIELWRVVP